MGKSLNFFLGWVRARARAPLIGSKTDTGGARAREPNQEKSLKFSHWMNKLTESHWSELETTLKDLHAQG